jgi:hypothetical protein
VKLRTQVSIQHGGEVLVYDLQQLPPTKAIKMMTRTIKLVGEPLLVMLAGGQRDITEVLPTVAKILREGLDENEVDSLIKEFMGCVFFQGQPVSPQFETHFMGKLPVIFKLLIEVLKLNYADFLGDFARENGLGLKANQ